MDILSSLHTGSLVVICAPSAASNQVSTLTASLALRGSVTILDGGNRFRPYEVARLLRQSTPEVNRIAKRIFIRRAFTCYQVLALLETTPALSQPYLILDLLASFYDEHVSLRESVRLLDTCLRQVERLLHLAPVLVTLAPARLPERAVLLEQVCARAGCLFAPEEPAAQVSQPVLFAS